MDHEVRISATPARVRAALRNPEIVARCLPDFTRDAEGPGTGGRLRLRIGGSTLTCRGTLATGESTGGEAVVLVAEGAEARGGGAVAATLGVRVLDVEGDPAASRLACTGSMTAEGRLADFEEGPLAAAGRRLLDRAAGRLGEETTRLGEVLDATEDAAEHRGATALRGEGDAGDTEDVEAAEAELAAAELAEAEDGDELADEVLADEVPADEEDAAARDDADLDEARAAAAMAEAELADGDFADLDDAVDDASAAVEPPVVSASAAPRRSLLERSAEEVDHYPPRGRLAPVRGAAGLDTPAIRWTAAATAVLAGAVLLGRALRGRRS